MNLKIIACFFLIGVVFLGYKCAFAEVIEDDIAMSSFQGKNFQKPLLPMVYIEDDTAESLQGKTFKKTVYKHELLADTIPDEYLNGRVLSKQKPVCKMIDENAEIIKVSIHPVKAITTKEGLKITDTVYFAVSKDVYNKEELFIKKDSPVSGFIELISPAERFGEPDEIELSRFLTADTKGNKIVLVGNVRKQGADRGLWVRPLYNTGYGMPFALVKGGRAKIKTTDEFELYYE